MKSFESLHQMVKSLIFLKLSLDNQIVASMMGNIVKCVRSEAMIDESG